MVFPIFRMSTDVTFPGVRLNLFEYVQDLQSAKASCSHLFYGNGHYWIHLSYLDVLMGSLLGENNLSIWQRIDLGIFLKQWAYF